MSYAAIVCSIKAIHKHPNADRLQICEVLGGFRTITGLDTKVGDRGIYFPEGGQLEESFALANGLIEILDQDTGKKIGGGYLNAKRRIRAMSLRGVRSDGLWLPITCLDHILTLDAMKSMAINEVIYLGTEGYEFDTICGVKICQKYIGIEKRSGGIPGEKKTKNKGRDYGSHANFQRHRDTAQLRTVIGSIPANIFLILTAKLHGTSAVTGNVLEEIELPFYKRAINWLLDKLKLSKYKFKPKQEYKYLIGSRNVVFVGKKDNYYKDDFRFDAANTFMEKLRKGETVYYEIVGYTNNGSTIMQSQTVTKEIRKAFKNTSKFPETMKYTYGCEPGKWDVYVYRITQMGEDGVIRDLSWNVVKERCKELELKSVPEFWIFKYNGDPSSLMDTIRAFIPDDAFVESEVDSKHIEEGLCIRLDDGADIATIYKHHSFAFKVLEGQLEIPDNEDTEDVGEEAKEVP